MTSTAQAVVVMVTAPNSDETAQRIARVLVEKRLAACVNIIPSVKSVYRWEGRIQTDSEQLLVIKSVRSQVGALTAEVIKNHPNQCVEVIALDVVGGNEKYISWVAGETDRSVARAFHH